MTEEDLKTFGYVYSDRWVKYGLCISRSIYDDEFNKAFQSHELVYDYLDNHPDINYTGNYFNILSLAEKERKMSMNRGA
jgi:hypothetical protein